MHLLHKLLCWLQLHDWTFGNEKRYSDTDLGAQEKWVCTHCQTSKWV